MCKEGNGKADKFEIFSTIYGNPSFTTKKYYI